MPEPADGRIAFGLVVGLVSPLLVGIAFFTGHDALDRSSPDVSTARAWYLGTVLVAAAVVYSMWPLLRPRVGAFAPWGILSLLPALWLAALFGTSYADLGDELGFVFVLLPAAALYYVGMLVLIVVQAIRGKVASATAPVLVAGAGVCAGFGLVAGYLLSTLQEQAEASRQAHQETSLPIGLALLGIVIALALIPKRAA